MTRKQIESKVSEYMSVLGLANWSVSLVYDDKEAFAGSNKYVALIDANTEYLTATIFFNPDLMDQVENTVIMHELIHCLTAESTQFARKRLSKKDEKWVRYFEERLVSQLERIMMRGVK